ncbi:MAG: hypothetical protein M3N59_02230 [bacterium]|nr:hypothetical protein [bacterium]
MAEVSIEMSLTCPDRAETGKEAAGVEEIRADPEHFHDYLERLVRADVAMAAVRKLPDRELDVPEVQGFLAQCLPEWSMARTSRVFDDVVLVRTFELPEGWTQLEGQFFGKIDRGRLPISRRYSQEGANSLQVLIGPEESRKPGRNSLVLAAHIEQEAVSLRNCLA